MKKQLLLLALTLVMIAGLLMVFTLPAAAADAPANLRIEPSETNGIPAQIDAFKARTGGTNYNPTYTYQLYLPGNVDWNNCFLSWDGGAAATLGGNTYASGSCPVPTPNTGTETTYTFKDGNTTLASLKVIAYQGSESVTPVFIVVDESDGKPTIAEMDADPDHEVTCSGIIYIDGAQYDMPKIKGRGNATWSGAKDKKPYNITLGAKINFPGVESDKTKKWSFLAEITDHSLLSNRSGYHLAYELGIGQDTTSADVWMNGEYQGCYTVTPKTDSFVSKNGFMIEQDNYKEPSVAEGGDPQFTLNGLLEASGWSSCYNRITVKKMGDNLLGKDELGEVNETPENLEDVALNTIKPWLQDAWDAIRSDTGYNDKGKYYTDYIDLESFAKMYLMHEYAKSYDVCAGSILFHRDGIADDDKLIAGPTWDLDNAMGSTCQNSSLGKADDRRNGDRRSGEGAFIASVTEYKTSIYKTISKHSDFMEEVNRQYNKNRSAFDALPDYVDGLISDIDASARMNHYKVNDLTGTYVNVHKYSSATALGSGQYRQSYLATTNSKTDWPNYAANLLTYTTTRTLWFHNTYYDPDYCEHDYVKTVTTQPTCTEEGLATYTCSKCGDSYTEAIPVLDHDYVDGVCVNCGFAAPRVTIICSNGASVTVYETKSFEGACVENAAFANPRNSDTGLIDCSGDGQINFVVNLETGYDLESVSAEPAGAYKNLKGPSDTGVENGYRLTKVSGDLTITVTTAANAYTVTWMSQDGSQILETDEDVPYGTAPDFGLPDPTKQANAQYAYEFAGWANVADQESGTLEADLPAVSGDATYYAAFRPVGRTYTVTWMSQDGSQTLETDENVPYGTQPSFDEADPTKAPTDEFTYTFAGWFNEPNKENGISEDHLDPATGDVTYYATFSEATRTYTVTWMSQDGSQILETDEGVPYGTAPDYNSAELTKPATNQFYYTFVGWAVSSNQTSGTPEEELTVIGDMTYYAAFGENIQKYTVTWMNQDGSQVLETDEDVPYGTAPDFGLADPTKQANAQYAYEFAGWATGADQESGTLEADLPAVSGDATYYAAFRPVGRTYTVTWMSQDGSQTLETDENVPYGTQPSFDEADPTKASTDEFNYTFTGWFNEPNKENGITENQLNPVAGNVTYYATFSEATRTYTVTWMSQDGSQILETDEGVPYGTAPDYNSAELTKPATNQFYYTFVGWAASAGQTSGAPEGELTVTGDMTYYAAFSETLRAYPITFVNDDGKVLQSSDVAYGYTPAYTGATPAKAPDAQYIYTFAGWDPAIVTVSGPATYTATYSVEEIGHTVDLHDLTNGKAEVTVLTDGGSYSGEVTFKVNCAHACAVRYSTNGGETYTRLSPASDGSYTLEIDQDMLIAVNVMGDINGDGDVNNKDVTRLMRYIKYKDVEVVDFALDVNGDGSVNNKDVTRLMRYIKYNDVEIS